MGLRRILCEAKILYVLDNEIVIMLVACVAVCELLSLNMND